LIHMQIVQCDSQFLRYSEILDFGYIWPWSLTSTGTVTYFEHCYRIECCRAKVCFPFLLCGWNTWR